LALTLSEREEISRSEVVYTSIRTVAVALGGAASKVVSPEIKYCDGLLRYQIVLLSSLLRARLWLRCRRHFTVTLNVTEVNSAKARNADKALADYGPN
jgi:hypothetical protein